MNYTRIVLGGLLGGLVMNLMEMFVGGMLLGMDKQWTDAITALGKSIPMSAGVMGGFLALYFVLGVLCAWGYAALRPRFGAGPGTAIRAGIYIWLLAALCPTVVNLILSIYPTRTLFTYLALSLVEFLVATLIAGWLYRESSAAEVRVKATGA